MTHLLDTNICIDVMRGVSGVHQALGRKPAGSVAMSAVTYFELFVGIKKSRDPAREKERLSRLMSAVPLFDFNMSAAEEAADIRAYLERRGCGIGPLDTLIAGHARSLGWIVVTGNLTEFSRVPNLHIEHWPQ